MDPYLNMIRIAGAYFVCYSRDRGLDLSSSLNLAYYYYISRPGYE